MLFALIIIHGFIKSWRNVIKVNNILQDTLFTLAKERFKVLKVALHLSIPLFTWLISIIEIESILIYFRRDVKLEVQCVKLQPSGFTRRRLHDSFTALAPINGPYR